MLSEDRIPPNADTKLQEPNPAVRSFSSWRATAVWVAVCACGALLFAKRAGVPGLVAGLAALYALQAAISFALGVRLSSSTVTLPRTVWVRAPLLVLGRKSFALPLVSEITSVGSVTIFELVHLAIGEGIQAALFDSQKGRRAFLEEMPRRQPLVKVYRV